MKKLFVAVLFFFCCSFKSDNKIYDLGIRNSKTQKYNHFNVSYSLTDESRSKGLMFVVDFPENYGMVFKFGEEKIVNMWMKNTKIPLDMLFIDKNDKIVHIKENAVPESLEIISSEKLVSSVMEIKGGKVKELGIEIGDEIIRDSWEQLSFYQRQQHIDDKGNIIIKIIKLEPKELNPL